MEFCSDMEAEKPSKYYVTIFKYDEEIQATPPSETW